MTSPPTPRSYEPNAALRLLYDRVFSTIQVDQAWVAEVRRLAGQGTVVYILRSLNFVDFLALDHLTKRHGLPQIRFVNDLRLGVLNPMGRGVLGALLPRAGATPAGDLREALRHGGSAALFLKRPPGMLDVAAGATGWRGLREGDELVRTLIDVQREQAAPILLVPQVFLWSRSADKRAGGLLELTLGPREWPSSLRSAGEFLLNRRQVTLRLGEPLDLAQYLANNEAPSDAVHVRRVTYVMLRRLERERRAVTGPADKAPDRVRHEITRSTRLRRVIDDLAGERAAERRVLLARADKMLRELQATLDISTIKGFDIVLYRVFHRIYAGIEYRPEDLDRVRAAARDGTLVLLPSHKSHIDYLILSYIFFREHLQLPLIAAGENLNFFPLGPIFRRGGAFFIRRSFKGDRLYQAVVDTYVRRLIRDGYPIELFLEGGRSRTGKLLPPKFGLLGMLVEAALAVRQRRTYFVPVSVGYERVVEATSYERELGGGEKTKEDAAGLLKTTDVLRHRYGRIVLQFGEPMTLDEIRSELGLPPGVDLDEAQVKALTTRLGNRTMDEINRVTAVTPGALAALALLSHARRGISHEDLVERCRRLLVLLAELEARMASALATPSGTLRPESLREAVQMFVDAGLVEAHAPELVEAPGERRAVPAGPGAVYTVPDGKRLALDTSKNMVIHFFVERALVALALEAGEGGPVAESSVRDRVQKLSRLFKHEFRFQADRPFDVIFDETVARMASVGVVVRSASGELGPGPGRLGWTGAEWLGTYAALLRSFLEGYRVAARSLGALVRGPLTEKELVKRALAQGQRMFLGGEIERPESVSKPVIQNAYLTFLDQGYLVRNDGKLALAGSFDTPRAVGAIEGRIAGYLRAPPRRGDA